MSREKVPILASFRLYLVFTLLLGLGYPFAVWVVGRAFFRDRAEGSWRECDGKVVGSELIAQGFSRPDLFHPRASAAGEKGWDAMSSGGTNLGPTSKRLAETIRGAVAAARAENPREPGPVPADMVTTSASGLDPDISPGNARWQIPRISKASGIPEAEVQAMVERRTEGRFLGIFGEPRVNVLQLNLDLLERSGTRADTNRLVERVDSDTSGGRP